MACACGSERVINNGGGRTRCRDCGKTGKASVLAPEQVEATSFARIGYAPDHDMRHTAAPGFQVKGVSSLYDEHGALRAQWVKTSQDREQMAAAMTAAVQALAEEIPRERARKAPAVTNADLANVYVVTDYHLGMLAWGDETSADSAKGGCDAQPTTAPLHVAGVHRAVAGLPAGQTGR